MSSTQPGILADVPAHARFLTFRLAHDVAPADALATLAGLPWDPSLLVGVGDPLARALARPIEGLAPFPAYATSVAVPSTPGVLWIRVSGDDRGDVWLAARAVVDALAAAFVLDEAVDGYRHGTGRDLTGYEDGTENPTGDAAASTAIVASRGDGLDGGSFLAVQRWVHDFARFGAMTPEERDLAVGRRRADNEEIEDAPASAHVRRTAQEDFTPAAFLLRRSMPWHGDDGAGLLFCSFGAGLGAFEAQLRRMVGLDDGVVDALFRFTRPVTGSYYFCPPLHDGRLDLRALGGL